MVPRPSARVHFKSSQVLAAAGAPAVWALVPSLLPSHRHCCPQWCGARVGGGGACWGRAASVVGGWPGVVGRARTFRLWGRWLSLVGLVLRLLSCPSAFTHTGGVAAPRVAAFGRGRAASPASGGVVACVVGRGLWARHLILVNRWRCWGWVACVPRAPPMALPFPCWSGVSCVWRWLSWGACARPLSCSGRVCGGGALPIRVGGLWVSASVP